MLKVENSYKNLNNIVDDLKNHKSLNPKLYDDTMLEVLNVLKKEEQHSNFIFWILTTLKDELGKNILAKRLVHEFGLPDRLIDELPIEISKERESLSGRIDIYVGWDNYSLLIENKVLSSEGEDQCRKYLSDYRINSSNDGKIIFLTLHGSTPKSLRDDDNYIDRYICLSYGNFLKILKDVKKDIPKKDVGKRYFINDYILSVERILKMGMREKEINEINPNSQLLFNNYKLFYDKSEGTPYGDAIKETSEILDLLRFKIYKTLNELDGEISNNESYFSNRVYFKDSWKLRIDKIDYVIGFYYEQYGMKTEKLLPEYSHNFGIRVKNIYEDKNSSKKSIRIIFDKIKELLQSTISMNKKGFNPFEDVHIATKDALEWVCVCEIQLDTKNMESWDEWIQRFLDKVIIIAKETVPLIDICANEFSNTSS